MGYSSNLDFSWRYKDFEICTSHGYSNGDPYIELVKHYMYDGRDCVFTLAYWKINRREPVVSLVFVGERPFEEIAEIDISVIWKQLWLAGAMLNDWLEKEIDDDD